MVVVAHADRERHDDEWRVIGRFANAWGYPIDRLEHLNQSIGRGYAPAIRRAWLSLRSLLVGESVTEAYGTASARDYGQVDTT
jgi:hypothetical protein